MRTERFKIVLFIIVILVCLYSVFTFFSTRSQKQLDAEVNAQTKTSIDSDRQMLWQGHMEDVVAVGDPAFTKFSSTTLQNACPYYQPDGYSYRGCLNDFIAKELKTFQGSETALQRSKDYCTKISKPYSGGLEESDLYSSCLAYKLSSEAI